jgi:hypothetical protein
MALPPSVQSGQSNSPQYSQPTQFVQQGYNAPGFQTGNIVGNPARVIEERIGGQRRQADYRFPFDLPKYHFTLIENEWTIGRQILFQKMFKLPLPTGLTSEHEVNYNTGFNYLSVLSSAAAAFTGGLSQLGQSAARAGGAALGLAVNNFKSVTLDVTDFRTFQLSWKLSPKNFDEAETIQKIIFSLKKAMHPRTFGDNFAPGVAATVATGVLIFPKIFTMYFVPNTKFLYKFKPCVLSSIKVDYAGGQPVPSFYASSGNPSDSPPESVLVSMNFIELEYWLSRDYILQNDMPTNDPFDAFRYYTYGAEVIPPDDSFLGRNVNGFPTPQARQEWEAGQTLRPGDRRRTLRPDVIRNGQ